MLAGLFHVPVGFTVVKNRCQRLCHGKKAEKTSYRREPEASRNEKISVGKIRYKFGT
jgi:hypothetical protein